jgi:holo-[acyl-carrier protein] synthase
MRVVSGVDLIEIERVQQVLDRHQERFLAKVFTPAEISAAGRSAASLAARFAAKEAVAKALGTGIGPVGWLEIEVLQGPERQPLLSLHGEAARLAAEAGLQSWSISLSHSQTHAVAVAVAIGL